MDQILSALGPAINQWAVQHAWIGVVIGVLWGVDQILKVIAPLTPTKIDDNIADYLGKFLASFKKT